MIKIAIFDDHAQRREALKFMIQFKEGMECVGDYEDCSGLVEQLTPNPPDVVLMDINMPGVDGIEGVKLLSEHFPSTFVIMQTVFEEDDKIFECLKAGAHGYILKKESNEKLTEAIQEVLNGGAPMTPSIAKRVLNYFGSKPKKGKDEEHNLSKRELDILKLLVKGLSHKMIAAELFISAFTVSNHIKNIYQKLHVHSVSEAVATALQKNIVGR